MQQVESGWVPYGGALVLEDFRFTDGIIGYLPVLDDPATRGERQPVYDQPDGELIGYDYTHLGFVPVDVADSGTFDAASLRVSRLGCDPIAEPGCHRNAVE